MCEEESEDHEAVAKLFEINDSIHRTIERYKLIKKGDIVGANNIKQGTLGISGAGVKKGANNELSLIDFGGLDDDAAADGSSSQPPPPPPKGNSLEDDLLGLSLGPGDAGFGSGGALSLGAPNNDLASFGSSTSNQAHKQKVSTSDIMSQFNAPSQLPASPSYNAFAQMSQPASIPTSPQTNLFSLQQATTSQPSQQQPQQPVHRADPFASLAGSSSSRTGSPYQVQSSFKAPAGPVASLQQQTRSRPTSLISNGDDGEWAFSSSLPPATQQPETKEIQVTNSSIRTVFRVSRPADANDWLAVHSSISNVTQSPIADLTFQLAVTKVCMQHRA